MRIIHFLAKRRLNYFDSFYLGLSWGVWSFGWYWAAAILVLGVVISSALEVIAGVQP